VERLVLLGPVRLSPAAVQTLLAARIPVVLAGTRGRYWGVLSAGCDDAEMLVAQVRRYQDATYRLGVARAVVGAKVEHQRRLLTRHGRNHPNPLLTEAAGKLAELRATLPTRASVAEVMGVEGRASGLYFSAFGACLRQEGLAFEGRNRRPPRDPVNAALSLGYMLVLAEMTTILIGEGLHPGIGFLHEVDRGRPALALDLLELARQPVVDRLTLSLFNRRVLSPADFTARPDGGVQLRPESLPRYLEFYERTMSTPFRLGPETAGNFRDWLRREAAGLRRALAEGAAWEPLVLEL
jgi:CRISPR-associated protein Cas1